MAAFDIGPWDTNVTQTKPITAGHDERSHSMTSEPPTYAAFSPSSSVQGPFTQRSTVIIHKKSPLLIATPPQITRALAYSHAFIIPINKLVGLISWTTGNAYESFLLLCGFWAVCLYGDAVIRFSWPLLLTAALTAGLYLRRFSPLSSTEWSKDGKRAANNGKKEADTFGHAKSLDEIVETLKEFTARCNIILDPFLRMTNFLSTQVTATSATTRPALMTLFLRVLIITPLWSILTLHPVSLITSRRVILTTGTIVLSWHSRAARVTRTILWRSRTIRQISSTITGLPLTQRPRKTPAGLNLRSMNSVSEIAAALAATRNDRTPNAVKRRDADAIRFTFVLYENQRRWIGLGWTGSMLAYERASWTDEQLNPAPPLKKFELPEVDGGLAQWRWCEDSEWQVEGTENEADSTKPAAKANRKGGDGGWVYYDNKWQGGERGKDGWGKYTRRRRWYRDAELVELTPSGQTTPGATPVTRDALAMTAADTSTQGSRTPVNHHEKTLSVDGESVGGRSPSKASQNRRSGAGWFGLRKRADSSTSQASAASSSVSRGMGSPRKRDGFFDTDDSNEGGSFVFAVDREAEEKDKGRDEDSFVPMHLRGRQGAAEAGWGDEMSMDLG